MVVFIATSHKRQLRRSHNAAVLRPRTGTYHYHSIYRGPPTLSVSETTPDHESLPRFSDDGDPLHPNAQALLRISDALCVAIRGGVTSAVRL
jgi:hypothetical protein